MLKKNRIIELLSEGKYKRTSIAKVVGCHHSYVSKIADCLGMAKKRSIMNFRGLLKGGRYYK